MKIYIVINVGRFPPGPTVVNMEDPVIIKIEMASADRAEIDSYLASLPQQALQKVPTDIGEMECLCQRGVYEVDLPLPSENPITDVPKRDLGTI